MTDQNSGDANQGPRGVAAGIVDQTPGRGPEHDRLQDFIGRWLTVGQTVAGPEMPSVPIFASDVYEWMPGRFFVLHTAYGRIGDIDVGGTEIIGFDPASQTYRTPLLRQPGKYQRAGVDCRRWHLDLARRTHALRKHRR